MKKPIFKYDELSDTLSVIFAREENATGIELNEHILLRINQTKKSAVGLTLFNYSILAQRTEIGYRSIPLDGLNKLPSEIRQMVIEILASSPVREILSLSAYTPPFSEMVPITSLQKSVLDKQAA
jgi:hypothetical protein